MVRQAPTRTNCQTVARAGSLLSLLVTALPTVVAAQFALPQFGVAAGAALPVGGLGTAWYLQGGWKVGWEGMALVAFRIGRSPLGVRLDGSYSVTTSIPSRHIFTFITSGQAGTLRFPRRCRRTSSARKTFMSDW
jgi:hypothetical protein